MFLLSWGIRCLSSQYYKQWHIPYKNHIPYSKNDIKVVHGFPDPKVPGALSTGFIAQGNSSAVIQTSVSIPAEGAAVSPSSSAMSFSVSKSYSIPEFPNSSIRVLCMHWSLPRIPRVDALWTEGRVWTLVLNLRSWSMNRQTRIADTLYRWLV